LATFSGQWLQESPHLSADISSARGDGVVDLRDFAAFARYWTRRPTSAPAPNLPAATQP
jgi:hypothetical protein